MTTPRQRARELRRDQTPAEKILWEQLRDRRLHGLKFLRQYPIGPFIADFCCRDRRIVVELDGEVHEGEQQQAYDQDRDAHLQGHHYVVLRFSNQQVFDDLDSVLKKISNATHIAPPPWLRPRAQEDRKTPSNSLSPREEDRKTTSNSLSPGEEDHKTPSNSPSPGEGGREGTGEGAGGVRAREGG